MVEHEKKEIGIDEKLSIGKSLFFGVQSVVALNLFLAGFIISGILKMDIPHTALLIGMSFLASGLATFLQAGFFMKYPNVQGVSFAIFGPIAAITFKYDFATAIGSFFLGAIVVFLLGQFNLFSKFVKACIPPLVAGVVVLVIGMSTMITGWTQLIASPGKITTNFGLAAISFCLIIFFLVISQRKGIIPTLLGRGGVLVAIVIATIVATLIGRTNFAPVANAPWFALPHLFPFGLPKFNLESSLIFVFIYLIVMIETMGNWFAISFTAKGTLTDKKINKGIAGEGLGCFVGALFGGAPVTSYATNCGILTVTKVYSYYAAVAAGLIIIALAFCPKLMFVIACIPGPVMWGVFCAMTMMIFSSGLRSIHQFGLSERNILVICIPLAITIGASLLPMSFVMSLPPLLSYFFASSIAVGALAAVVVGLLLPDKKNKEVVSEEGITELGKNEA